MAVSHDGNLVWRNSQNDYVINWNLVAGQLQSVTILGTMPDYVRAADTHGDYNGDGHADILWQDTIGNTAQIWELNDTQIAGVGYYGQIPASDDFLSGHGDFNGDGKDDVLPSVFFDDGINQLHVLQGWYMNATQVQSESAIGADPLVYDFIDGSGDYNADGSNDVLVRDRDNGTVIGLQTRAPPTQALIRGFGTVPTYLSIVDGHGDFNNDGKSDILWRNHVSGDVVVWTMNGNVANVQTIAAGIPAALFIVDAHGDYNGDGTSDILWRNSANGEVVEWLMSNGQISSVKSLGMVPTSFTILDGHSDYTGDTTSDLLWRDGANGHTVIWQMAQGMIAGVSDFGVIPIYLSLADPGEKGATIIPDQNGGTYYGTVGNNTFYVNAFVSTYIGGAGENTYVVQAQRVTHVNDFKANIDQFQLDHTKLTNFTTFGYLSDSFFIQGADPGSPNPAATAPTGEYIVEDTLGQLWETHHVANGSNTAGIFAVLGHAMNLSAHDFLII
jgi:hypothetical protein